MPEAIDVIMLGSGSSVPTPQRAHPAMLLIYRGQHLLFDCGEGTQTRLMAAGISPLKINKIFISHWHADHFSGLLPMLETMHLGSMKKTLEIYGPDAERFVDELLNLSYWSVGFDVKAINTDPEADMQRIYTGDGFDIFSIKAKHSVPANGYMFKEHDRWNIIVSRAKRFGLSGKVLNTIKENGKIIKCGKTIMLSQIAKFTPGRRIIYSGDTAPCKAIFSAAKNADLLIHDSTFIEENKATKIRHSSVARVAKAAAHAHVKRLILTHFSHRYKNENDFLKIAKKYFKKTFLAKDGMRLRL